MRRELPDAAQVERALATVYARPELSPPPPSPLQVWLGEAWSALRQWVGRWLPSVQLGEADAGPLAWIVIALLVLVAIGVALHFTGVLGAWWRARPRGAAAAAPTGPAPGSPQSSLAVWEARARHAAAEARWREATLALYQMLLLRLELRGIVRYDVAKTPGDYRREVRREPGADRAFDEFLRGFEPAVYGTRQPDRSVFLRLESLAAEAAARG